MMSSSYGCGGFFLHSESLILSQSTVLRPILVKYEVLTYGTCSSGVSIDQYSIFFPQFRPVG